MTVQPPAVTLQTLAENEHTWWHVADQQTYELVFHGDQGHHAQLFSVAELADIDARLAITVRHLITGTKATDPMGKNLWSLISVRYLQQSIRFWLEQKSRPVIPLSLSDGNRQTYLDRIHAVTLNSDTAMCAIVGTYLYTTCVDNVTIVMGIDRRFDTSVPLLWLETHFPGVTSRLQCAAGFGLTPEEQAHYGLYDNYVQAPINAALPDGLINNDREVLQ